MMLVDGGPGGVVVGVLGKASRRSDLWMGL